MNTSPVITQALLAARQQDRLARARQSREARFARATQQARRTPAEAPVRPVYRIRLTLRPWVLRGAI